MCGPKCNYDEKRLIDANALHNRIEMNLRASNPFTIEECCYKDALNSVDEAPTIDPDDLRGHAKWEKPKELFFIMIDGDGPGERSRSLFLRPD